MIVKSRGQNCYTFFEGVQKLEVHTIIKSFYDGHGCSILIATWKSIQTSHRHTLVYVCVKLSFSIAWSHTHTQLRESEQFNCFMAWCNVHVIKPFILHRNVPSSIHVPIQCKKVTGSDSKNWQDRASILAISQLLKARQSCLAKNNYSRDSKRILRLITESLGIKHLSLSLHLSDLII